MWDKRDIKIPHKSLCVHLINKHTHGEVATSIHLEDSYHLSQHSSAEGSCQRSSDERLTTTPTNQLNQGEEI